MVQGQARLPATASAPGAGSCAFDAREAPGAAAPWRTEKRRCTAAPQLESVQ